MCTYLIINCEYGIDINYTSRDKHSSFSTAYPIYLWATKSEEVPLVPGDEGYVEPVEEKETEAAAKDEKTFSDDEDLIVEDAAEATPEVKTPAEPLTKTVTSNVWDHLNSQPPLWMRYEGHLSLTYR